MLEYELIAAYYEGKVAARSGLPYMNHIDEGLMLLKAMGAPQEALPAFCLHPIAQNGDEAEQAYAQKSPVWFYAERYALVANCYLPQNTPPIDLPRDERRTAITAHFSQEARHDLQDRVITAMLFADKLQNDKDARRMGYKSHHTDQLEQYFKDWLWLIGKDKLNGT